MEKCFQMFCKNLAMLLFLFVNSCHDLIKIIHHHVHFFFLVSLTRSKECKLIENTFLSNFTETNTLHMI